MGALIAHRDWAPRRRPCKLNHQHTVAATNSSREPRCAYGVHTRQHRPPRPIARRDGADHPAAFCCRFLAGKTPRGPWHEARMQHFDGARVHSLANTGSSSRASVAGNGSPNHFAIPPITTCRHRQASPLPGLDVSEADPGSTGHPLPEPFRSSVTQQLAMTHHHQTGNVA